MLIGYNNDVEYRGKTFHIQTEDHGRQDPRIESQIFHQGQILDTEIVSYGNILEEADEEDATDDKLKSLMWTTHKGLYRRLMSGNYDEAVGLEPVDDPEEIDATDPDEFEPGQDRVPAAAQKIEEQGQDALEQFHANKARKHTDLDSLKGRLSELKEKKDKGGSEDEGIESETSTVSEDSDGVITSSAPKPEPSGSASSASSVDRSSAGESEVDALDSDAELDEPTAGELLAEEEDSGGLESDVSEEPGVAEGEIAAGGLAEIEGDSPVVGSSQTEADPSTSVDSAETADASPVEFADGAEAWRGCDPSGDSLDLVPLVEEFIEQ